MRILILGGDGYLGWPQAMYFSQRGHEVFLMDNFARRHFDLIHDCHSLNPIPSLQKRIKLWNDVTKVNIPFKYGSTTDFSALKGVVSDFKPDSIVHFAEQKSAPYSMLDREHAIETMRNNIDGTMNVLYAIKESAPDCHLIKLGTMGEYGTPNIDIEEGYIDIEHKGRKDRFLYPKNPGSFYHLSKVHDSYNIKKCCDWWGLKATDLNQGVVYGVETEEAKLATGLETRYDYDQIYGTALNRFCTQAAIDHPLIVHGRGGQTRGFLNIKDALRCIELAVLNPPSKGEYRVFNQFTEMFSVSDLAERVKAIAVNMGHDVHVQKIDNPRIEAEEHYYNAQNSLLKNLGLKPTLLNEEVIKNLISIAEKYKSNIEPEHIRPSVRWTQTSNLI